MKENEISHIIPPGAIMMTPTAEKKEKSPNKSVRKLKFDFSRFNETKK